MVRSDDSNILAYLHMAETFFYQNGTVAGSQAASCGIRLIKSFHAHDKRVIPGWSRALLCLHHKTCFGEGIWAGRWESGFSGL